MTDQTEDSGDRPDAVVDPAAQAVAWHLEQIRHLTNPTREPHVGAATRLARDAANRVRSAPHSTTQHDIDGHLADAIAALADRVSRVAEWQSTDHELIGAVRGTLHHEAERSDAIEHGFAGLMREHGSITEAVRRFDTELDEFRARLGELQSLRDLLSRSRLTATTAVQPAPDTFDGSSADQGRDDNQAGLDQLDLGALSSADAQEIQRRSIDELYRDLERTFRGTREHVMHLSEIYLADVSAVGGPVLDIGCGRGEWLELLAEHDVDAYGVDLNETFASENRERGLDVRTGDAIAHLAGLEPATLGVVTGFHLAEHLPFEVLIDLADQALRALRPGGLLILESPNPTNVRVGASQFWIDPTHIRPLHPDLLRFVLLQRGFRSADLRPLHPAAYYDLDWVAALGGTATDQGRALLDEVRSALCGPMDFAIIATRGT